MQVRMKFNTHKRTAGALAVCAFMHVSRHVLGVHWHCVFTGHLSIFIFQRSPRLVAHPLVSRSSSHTISLSHHPEIRDSFSDYRVLSYG